MAQYILKFEEGGYTIKREEKVPVRTTQRGTQKVKTDDWLTRITEKTDGYVNAIKGLNDNEKSELRSAIATILNEINNGTLTPDLFANKGYGSSLDPNNKINKYAYNLAHQTLQQVNAYDEEAEKKKEKEDKRKNGSIYDATKGLSSDINKYLFSGRTDFNKDFLLRDDWNGTDRSITNRSIALISALTDVKNRILNGNLYQDDEDDNLQNLLKGIDRSIEALKDGKLKDNERETLSNLGIDPDIYLYTKEKYEDVDKLPESEKTELEKEQERAAKILEQLQLDALKTYNNYHEVPNMPGLVLGLSNYGNIKSPWEGHYQGAGYEAFNKQKAGILLDYYMKFLNFLNTHDVYKWSETQWNKKASPNLFGIDNYKIKNSDGYYTHLIDPNWTNRELFTFLMQNFVNHHPEGDPNSILPDGRMVMYTDINSGYSRVFDPRTKQMLNVPLSSIPGLAEDAAHKKVFGTSLQANYETPSQKQGGEIKKHLYGGYLEVPDINQIAEEARQAKREAYELKIKESGKTKEQYEAANRNLKDGLTGVDIARMTAIGADLAGIIASTTGAGAPIGGALSLGATLTELGADIADDAVSGWDTVKNLGIGLGLSAASFIPFVGGAGKAAKTIANGVKMAVRMIPIALSAGIIFDKDVQNTLDKISKYGISGIDKGKYTNDDLRNLTLFFGAITGVSRQGLATWQKSVIKKAATKTETTGKAFQINGKTIDETTYNKLNKAKTVEEAKNILSEGGYNDVNIEGRGTRWKMGLGEKKIFDPKQNGLRFVDSTYKYSLDPNTLTRAGLYFIGAKRPWWIPNWGLNQNMINQTLRYLNNDSGWFTNGIFIKNKPTTITSSTIPSASSAVATARAAISSPVVSRVIPGHGPNPRSVSGFRTPGQAWSKGYGKDFAIGDGRNQREIDLGIEFDKQGGKINSFVNGERAYKIAKKAQGGRVLKFLNPATPIWYDENDWMNAVTYDNRFMLKPGTQTHTLRGTTNATNNLIKNDDLYDPEGDATWLESQDYYNNWFNKLISDSVIAEKWARQYIDLHSDLNIKNKYNTSWFGLNNLFNITNFKNDVSRLAKDGKLGIGHDMIMSTYYDPISKRYVNALPDGWEEDGDWNLDKNKSAFIKNIKQSNPQLNPQTPDNINLKKKYFYKDKSGNITYVDNPDEKEWIIAKNPSIVNDEDSEFKGQTRYLLEDPDTWFEDYELTKRSELEGEDPTFNQSEIKNNLLTNRIAEFSSRLANLFGANAVIDRNKKDEKNKAALENPYYTHFNTYGDFEGLMMGTLQGANLMRQAKQAATADAQVNQAFFNTAFQQALDNQHKWARQDSQVKKETNDRDIAASNENVKIRNAVANKNAREIRDVNFYNRRIDAMARLNKFNNWKTFINELRQDLNTQYADSRVWYENEANAMVKDQFELELEPFADELRIASAANPNTAIEDLPEYKKYIQKARELNYKMRNSLSTLIGKPLYEISSEYIMPFNY